MARPPKSRRVQCLPPVSVFKPAGLPAMDLVEEMLSIEELEALRLKDYEGLEQEECAVQMQVSRPTFQRILVSAHEKVARALVEGHSIRVEGGNYRLVLHRMKCDACGNQFEVPCRRVRTACPECGSEEIDCLDPCKKGEGRCCEGNR